MSEALATRISRGNWFLGGSAEAFVIRRTTVYFRTELLTIA